MSLTRTFTPDQLDAIGVPFETYDEPVDGFATELHREQIDARRWVSVHALVFRAPDDGKAYRVSYQRPLTEHQEADPWFGDSTVTATEVVQRAVTVQQWKDATEQLEPTPSPTLVAWADALTPFHRTRDSALTGARALLAGHARELAARIRNSETLRNFTDDHMSDMNEAAAELDRYADDLDQQSAGGERP